ncbi:MAG: enoyl-CoA hydratase/isomerase family protein [Oceanicaulis sp.]|uniref:enoyl-CoA hydratase-related protein n=1 Tax=Glycocaulis sp. TaxID=1969725 RepID=UPI0025C71571|nr:enoyl-CoA hydratase-related protein [Glycocaulis sp.]MCC5981066.1 enoyl-CoA hydratase/isomerase family protein [Oceanicaulis sp.]MCH8522659.1 enoyl-CoA hydratase/isomerase family protein [Glycocaulis sp.]
MSYSTITYAVSDHIALVTLNRPEAMNAFTHEMGRELVAAFDESDADPDVHAVIVTGAGKAFCAGADLSTGAETFNAVAQAAASGELNETDPEWRDSGGLLNLRIFNSAKPVIGAINGAAVGIGATMILPMDIRIAAQDAKMAYPFTKRGIAWDGCASWFLPRVVGIETALDWGLTGRTFMSEEAFAKGLVSELVPAEQVLERAYERARAMITATSPVSVSMNRYLAWQMLGASHPMEAHRLESRAILRRGMSEDAREGVMSFLEKRPPAFPGKVPADLPPGWPYRSDPEY